MSADIAVAADTIAKAIDGVDCGDVELRSIANAITNAFQSPNVSDSNGEEANVVDAIAQVGSGLHAIANAIQGLESTLGRIAGLPGGR